MLEFAEVSIEDKCRLQKILQKENDRDCEYTFGNVIIWSKIYATKVAYIGEGAVIRHDRHGVGYLFPVGEYDLKVVIDSMIEDAKHEKDKFSILAADIKDFNRLEEAFPGVFKYKEERDYAEYIYLSEDLRELQGKKYHGKRNHINRFIENHPDYEFKIIDKDNIGRVREMNDEWWSHYSDEMNRNLIDEQHATYSAFDNFFEIDLDGGFIESEGKILAYSMGEKINDRTYCVHIEKAFHEVQGSYAIINRDFARHFCKDFLYINREDDVGEEGLRRAKMSYYPIKITDKITVTFR